MSFRNFTTGNSHYFGGKFLKLKPGRKIVYTEAFDDPGLPGEMTVSVTLNEVPSGTEIDIEQSGVPDAIPPDGCYLGWQESLNKLKQLVEPDIPE